MPKPWVRLPATPVSQDYLDEHEVCYGTLNVPIVGCQYYQGVLHQGEMASLVREPNNQYDKNAIRVDNLSAAQVGHVKRTYAAALAPIMDDPSPAAPRVEVTIPREPTNMYEVLGELKMIGLKEHAEAAVAALRAGGHYTLKDGYAAKAAAAQQAAAQLAAQQAAAAQQAWQQQLAWQQPVAQPVQVVKMDAASCERELDALFEKELALQGAISTDAAAAALSASVVRSALLPHQLQALAWMMAQEDEATPPPASVYERRLEKGQEVWFCTVTNSSTAVKPHGARGGLLCDDMGLGKTLTTLALIAVNQPDGVRLSGAAPAAPAAPAKEEEMAEAAAAEDEAAAAEEEAEEEEQEEFDEEEEVRQAKRLRVGELREALAAHGQEESGTKPVLVERLVNTKRSAAAAARAAKQLSAAAAAKQAASAAAAKAASAEEAEGRSVAAEAAAAAHAAGCGGTLVVCPTSVLSNWATQMGEHVPGALRVATHHGAGKESAEGLAAAHVVLTTYGTLGAEWKAWTAAKEGGGGKKRKQGAHGSLFDLHWHRIVLDEARATRAHAPAPLSCEGLAAAARQPAPALTRAFGAFAPDRRTRSATRPRSRARPRSRCAARAAGA